MHYALCLVAAMVSAGGCQSPGDMTPKPQQARAVDIVWRQVYGQHDSAPDIEWHHDCQLWDGTKGFTFAGWKVLVVDDEQPPATFRFSNVSLAHELMHERTFERTGDVDALHIRGDWDLESDVIAALQAAGL